MTPQLAAAVSAKLAHGTNGSRAQMTPEPVALPKPALEKHVHQILGLLGEDVHREGLIKTPHRVAKAWLDLTGGYAQDPCAILRSALFEEEHFEPVVVRDIEFFSLCEHHMLPFFGRAHIAYVPNGRIVGLSKLPRVVDALSRRLQVQERLTREIRDAVHDAVAPQGVAVVVEAQHLCMAMRGVQKTGSLTTTQSIRGAYFDDPNHRRDILATLTRSA